ncbi:MAG: M48 family metallopeptidase [Lachnospiraceae bacterium]|nr:M48 family metallopeptidase [Lachnospiraceae bacterium]
MSRKNNNRIEIRIIKSSRKTMTLEVNAKGEVIVRAPYSMPDAKIRSFIKEKESWLVKTLTEVEEKKNNHAQVEALTEEELNRLGDLALKVLPERVKLFASMMGVSYGKITIRCQKTRWGSCSAKGNLNFNCLLMLAPEKVQDYVVVHELCHRLEMNHSGRFWAEVERVMPDYRIYRQWLKEHGSELMAKRP